MTVTNRPALILFASLALFAAPARAQEAASSDPTSDEQQIGPYVAPDIELPDPQERFDPRGKTVSVPGLDGVVVRHRAGAGLWLGEAPGSANVFLKPARSRVSVDVKVDF